ncbi:SpoIIE family protein phosphatase [Bacteroidota bacterium]
MSFSRHALLVVLILFTGFSQLLSGNTLYPHLFNTGFSISTNNVNDLFQDRKGNKWNTGNDGLNSLNGSEYLAYRSDTLYSDSIASEFIYTLELEDPKYKEYSYRVNNSSEIGTWTNIGNEKSIILSGLSHGKYTIEFQGENKEGHKIILPADINLRVKAPFQRHWIFIGIMILPLLILIYFLYLFKIKALIKSNRIFREKEIVAKEVLRQKILLSKRTQGIEDSLRYAQRIQQAMFTSEVEIRKMFPESFILQRPKDIVSGDFYWAKKIGSKVFIAAADCTGHGVPGAFMSLIGLEFFRQIVGGQGVHKPSMILNEINRNFDLVFDQEDDLRMRDGMDLAFCVIDTNTNILEYSGAFNPLYIIRDEEIIEIKADKIMLGPDLGYGRKPFKNNVFELQRDDAIYMFSDGYVDQFGGFEGRKFMFRRFRHLLLSISDQPMDMQHKLLENSMIDWQGSYDQVDDILVMGFRPVLSI